MTNAEEWKKVKRSVKGLVFNEDEPSEELIRSALELIAQSHHLGDDEDGLETAFRELRSELILKIDEGITLTDKSDVWKPWFPDLQADEKWDTPRSTSYYQYLIQDRDSEYATLDHTANEVIELLSDPRRTQPPRTPQRPDSRRRAVRKDAHLYRSHA
ncbi:hypothetical protein [Bifidobacterium moukalabense]|uniref:Endonuclease n=1 Tax=Bifidobacterium moukalabense DSM 27321 TaxID=1435051 RepID=W4N9R9_9BIFI|nr:hypothetical protein [Bifidobacterium moukalabense]ETY71789.1 endonuclease [Bifidobacterium moukalabense DSM 27321]